MSALIQVGPAPRIAVEVAGAGPLIVLLHGIGGGRANWRAQLDAFADRFTVAAWDARGFGASDDYDGPLAFADFSNDLVRVIDHLGAAQATLVGLSMGGRIALDFYGRHPDRVAALVLADTSVARRGPRKEAEVAAWLDARRRPLVEEGKEPRDIAEAIARSLVEPERAPQAYAEMVATIGGLRKDSYLNTLETVTRYEGFPPLASVAVPTLVLTGELDRIAPPELARLTAAEIPGAQLAILPGVGHMSNLEDAQAFNAAVSMFLASLPPATLSASAAAEQ
jgi:3-oxoadipate enol-lactonase